METLKRKPQPGLINISASPTHAFCINFNSLAPIIIMSGGSRLNLKFLGAAHEILSEETSRIGFSGALKYSSTKTLLNREGAPKLGFCVLHANQAVPAEADWIIERVKTSSMGAVCAARQKFNALRSMQLNSSLWKRAEGFFFILGGVKRL